VTAIALRVQQDFEKWFWRAWLIVAFVAFAFVVGKRFAEPGLGQVPLKPCKTCAGCACPKTLGQTRCLCPE